MNGGIYKKEIQNQISLNAQQMNEKTKKKKLLMNITVGQSVDFVYVL